jgi:putative cell wall binding repeat protein
VARQQPINADVPAETGGTAGTATAAEAPPRRPPRPRRRRRAIPAALKGIAGLVVLAVVFIVAAILGGGSSEQPIADSPAPVGRPPAPGEGPAGEALGELGYPAFATSNTTRVGGSDPASNAAGIALAVYPATDGAQRPTAVVLVDGDDWQGGVAASVLMAAPLGAPLLIAEDGDLPDPTAEALDELDPQGNAESAGAAAFAVGDAAAPEGIETKRVAGADAAATAAAIASLRDRLFDRPPRHLLIAPAADAAFALPAAAWAARSGDPVLFAGREGLPKATAAALRRHRGAPVYVIGPSSAISSSVVRQIAKVAGQVRRVSGEDPVENAIALARYSDGDFGWNVNDPGHGFVVVRSDSPLDAVAAAPLSASGSWGPLLLTDSADTLPAALRGYLLDVKPGYTTDPTRAFYNHVWVIGDEGAIDVSQQAEIDELAELAEIGGDGP